MLLNQARYQADWLLWNEFARFHNSILLITNLNVLALPKNIEVNKKDKESKNIGFDRNGIHGFYQNFLEDSDSMDLLEN